MHVNDQAREKARYWLDKIRGDLDGDVKKWRRLRPVPDTVEESDE